MDALFERLRLGLAPRYELVRQLAAGGMGIVYLAQDPALRRPVAVKVLMPGLATVAEAARFLREARMLAKIAHPNVVTVHEAGEVDGLFYYVMEYVEGETLAGRLAEAGPLEAEAVDRLARDILTGLGAAHDAAIIHRDIKPSNILLKPDRALVGDFGIARAETTVTVTEPPGAEWAGTPGYMAPEQRWGAPPTAQTDLYAVGLVLYEATTGTPWPPGTPPQAGDWAGVPARIRGPLRRALALDARDRWPSAAAMRAGWSGGAPNVRPWLVLVPVVIAAAALVWLVTRTPTPVARGTMPLHVAGFVTAPAAWGDSLDRALRDRLSRNTDFALRSRESEGRIRIVPAARTEGASIRLTAELLGPDLPATLTVTTATRPRADWVALLDALTDSIVQALYLGETDTDGWLPRKALPTTPAGLQAWFRAERAWSGARYEQAFRLYRDAEALDSTCLLCAYRLMDVERWLARPETPGRVDRVLAHEDRFPPHYRSLIRAYAAPAPARYDLLKQAAEETKDFAVGWFEAGDEAFHRAVLRGKRRKEALELLSRAVKLKPSFAPGWEHLAWLALSLGDRSRASAALDSLDQAPMEGGISEGIKQCLHIAFLWRFASPTAARERIDQVLQTPHIWDLPDVGAGPRILPTMGSPEAAVYMGGRFAEQLTRPDLVQSGRLAQLFGATALGGDEEAGRAAEQLRRLDRGPELTLFLFEWEAAQALFRADSSRQKASLRELAGFASETDQPALRNRAQWMLSMLTGVRRSEQKGAGSVPVPDELKLALSADQLARQGNPAAAVAMTDSMHPLEPGPSVDPFLPTLLRWRRGDWLLQIRQYGGVKRELRSYEHLHLYRTPVDAAQAAEVDWAFGPYFAWRRAGILAMLGNEGDELCAVLSETARLWRAGSAWARARADSATAALAVHKCPAP
ncbi:MAG: serine/threonine-protein kinase [Gemmatimonadota bacterium]